MTEEAESSAKPKRAHSSWIRAQDFAWLLFIASLIITTPETNYNFTILLVVIAASQIAEPRLNLFSSPRGQIASVVLKMIFCYLLVGYTHTLFSPYYPIFLVPVVSAATLFELAGVVLVTGIAFLAYFSFLLPIFIDWNTFILPPGHLSLMGLRASFFALVAFLVYEQAHAKREEMERTEEVVQRLSESNQSLRRAEASLRRSERLAALGQLTAGLAHELRNPLGTIKASAEMLTKSVAQKQSEVATEMAGYIESEVDRVNALIASFLDFARPLQIHPEMAELKQMIEEVVREQSELARKREVSLEATMKDPSLRFAFDPSLMRLALSNLVQNAIQASAAGKAVRIRAEDDEQKVCISVIDEGEGIQKQHRENIFNPFFTTKPTGVGLGLPIVSKIVDEHAGRIQVFSDAGVGTKFEIVLPRENRK